MVAVQKVDRFSGFFTINLCSNLVDRDIGMAPRLHHARFWKNGYCGVNPLFALFCCTIPPQKSAHMFLLYYTPCGLRGHCTTNTVHDNGEYPLLLQGGFSTVGTHADVVLYPLKFEGVLYNEHSAWQWRIPPYLALPGFGQVSLVRLGIINMLPGNTKWGGILRFFRKRSWAFYPLESKCHRAIQNEGEFSGFFTRRSQAFYPLESKCRRAIQNEGEFSSFLQGDHWHFTPCNPLKGQGASSLFRAAGGLLHNYHKKNYAQWSNTVRRRNIGT